MRRIFTLKTIKKLEKYGFKGKNVEEIASDLNLSLKTMSNWLFKTSKRIFTGKN